MMGGGKRGWGCRLLSPPLEYLSKEMILLKCLNLILTKPKILASTLIYFSYHAWEKNRSCNAIFGVLPNPLLQLLASNLNTIIKTSFRLVKMLIPKGWKGGGGEGGAGGVGGEGGVGQTNFSPMAQMRVVVIVADPKASSACIGLGISRLGKLNNEGDSSKVPLLPPPAHRFVCVERHAMRLNSESKTLEANFGCQKSYMF